ncbi:MAG: AmmeMemoRadiSam system radical SAM enzyme [Patescibacteria group bacterium]|nr:AmmeMemoRadiSam system radical SAM enzyme [Patescibacteria group bacterium]
MKEALLYEKLANKVVRCQACAHRCFIAEKKRGFCGVRENQGGKLYSLVYGKVIACHIDPIEKKPFFHWLPGSYSLSIATVGCNFRCLHCQNADISQMPRDADGQILGEVMSPQEIVDLARKNNLPSISYTYTEPTVFLEFALETMKLAKKENLKNNWVTNGYLSEKTLRLISPYLDAANVDLKFFSDDLYQKICGATLQPVLDSLKLMKRKKIWLEVTTLVIPGYTNQDNQFEKMATFIKNELGPETPWHISRFYPAYKTINLSPTPPEMIYQAYEIGKKIGLKYVYVGNLPGDEKENTYCPKCGQLNIKRIAYEIERFDQEGKCRRCQENLNLILK